MHRRRSTRHQCVKQLRSQHGSTTFVVTPRHSNSAVERLQGQSLGVVDRLDRVVFPDILGQRVHPRLGVERPRREPTKNCVAVSGGGPAARSQHGGPPCLIGHLLPASRRAVDPHGRGD